MTANVGSATARSRTPWARPSAVRDDRDDRLNAELDGAPAEGLADRRATVSWEIDGAKVTADLRAAGQMLEVRRFVVEVEAGSVPPAARRLPDDAAVLRALSRYGSSGRDTIRYLFTGAARMKAWASARLASGSTLDNKFLDQVARDFVQEQVAGPRSRTAISAEVAVVQAVLRKGGEAAKTKNVIAMLQTRYPDMSETTAYRRLREANLRLRAGTPRTN